MQKTVHLTPHDLAILGYKDLSLISETERFLFTRARTQDDQSILIKAPATTKPSTQLIGQLEHEFEIARCLNPAYVVRPVKIDRSTAPATLLLETCDYPPLTELLQAPLKLKTFFPIAIGIVTALSAVHSQRVVHKDIKPENILATVEGEVRLTGFGIASRLSRELQAQEPPEVINGTLAYMAPEQTGRMNRSIDTRSDLYSLGVTFYQMLTGQLPFTASDPMGWVHCHIAIQPKPPRHHLSTIPKPLSDLVMKLLEKTAQARYQTAEGLKADLEHCFQEWRTQGRIKPFPLGVQDIPDRLLIPEKLYGREREVAALLEGFERMVSSGKPVLVLVSGFAGIGKSTVVNELRRALIPSRGLFASGKFDQYKRGIPYASFTQAFRMLIRPLLGKSESELEAWRRDLQEALDPNGQLIMDLVPELKIILGEQPPLPELDPQQVKSRFQQVLRRFIGVFARAEHPLALFIDDLQWLDAATLDLIEDLSTHEEVRQLLLVGAYRDNEVGSDHPLMQKLEFIRKSGIHILEIKLSPLVLADLTKLVMDTLYCEPERASSLAELLYAKTAGNPFFTIQFLTTLAQEGLLVFDYGEGRWSWDLKRIQAKEYTDNVAELMVTKLNHLPRDAQRVMQQLTCLGSCSQTQTLSQVLQTTEEEVDVALQEAVRQEFVNKVGNAYHFVHDRVQEAAYALIPETLRAETHLRIGRALLAHTPEAEREDNVFELANQLNRGAALIDTNEEREELARLNLLAGQRAKGSAAYTEALSYLAAGVSLLSEACWENLHQLAFALEINRAECEYLTGELEIAENRLEVLSPRAASNLERARITSLGVDLYMTLGQIGRAVAVGLDYLRHLGIDWPLHPTEEDAKDEYDLIWSTIGDRTIEDLIDLPIMNEPALLATMEILIKLRPPALFTDMNLVSMVICKAVNLSLMHGNSDGSCFAYASLGIVAGSRYGNYEGAYRFGKLGYDLVEQRGLRRFQARTYTNFGIFDLPWVKHVRTGRDLLRRAFSDTIRSGDIIYGAYACNNLISNLLMAGDPLAEVEHEASKGLDYVNQARFGLVADIITSQLGLIRSLRGGSRQLGSFDSDQFNERQFESHIAETPELAVAACFHWIRKLQALIIAGDYAAATEASEKAQQLLWTAKPFIEMAEYTFYAALSRTLCCDSPTDDIYQQHKESIAEQLKQLETWANLCPDNFDNRASLVSAEIARIEGRPLDAMQLYEKSIQSAHSNAFVHNEALANELAGRFYLGRGLESTGLAHLRQARSCYIAWGADGKRQQLDLRYPQLVAEQNTVANLRVDSGTSQFDMATVIKASHAVSGEIELPKLIETLITLAFKYAGADSGLLFLPRDNHFEVEVEAEARDTGIEVRFVHSPVAKTRYSRNIVNYVINSRKSIIIDDALQPGKFLDDHYLRWGRARSVLSLPLLRQGRLCGVLYLENTQTTAVFTPDRVAVLDVLAAQAAISLENARLYGDLRESEAKYQRMFKTANEGIWIQDEHFISTFVNEHMAEMLGYSAADLIGHQVIEFMFEEDALDHRSKMEERSRNISDVYERRMCHKDGSTVWMQISATPIFEEGHFRGSFAMFSDITERKMAEQQLASSEHLFRTLVENSPDFIARYDLDLNLAYINPTLQRLFDVPPGQALGETAENASPLIDPERYMANLGRVVETGRERSDETIYQMRHGEIRWASTRFVPEIGVDGKVESVLVISNDITEQKHAEFERQEYLHFLKSLDRINRVLQAEGDIAETMNRALTEVLAIFKCDRAFLLYPSEPDAATWSVPMESTRPEFPGVGGLGPQPMEDGFSLIMNLLLESQHPLQFGPDGVVPVPESFRERFGTHAVMAMILRPRTDKPWQFGIQQCSHDRIWTNQELRLFEEIGNRLSDGLNDLMVTRNLRESEERFRLVYENSPVPTWEEDFSEVKVRLDELQASCGGDLETCLDEHPEILEECAALVRIINVNSAALELHQADSKQALYEDLTRTFTPDSYTAFRQELIALARGETELNIDSAVQTLSGQRLEVNVSFVVCPGYEHSLSKVFVSLFDITHRKQDEERLRLAASVFSTSQEGILISDADNRIIDINPAFTRLTGYSREEAIGRDPGFLRSNEQDRGFYAQMWQTINSTGEWQGELWNRRKSGEVYPELLSIVAVKDEQGQLQHYVGVFSDISMIKQHEADLDRIAHYDMLTSVPNRRLLGDRLEQALAHTRRHGRNLAVCYLDLDGFKPINDRFGHEGGDRMLIEIASRLQVMSRGEDTVARLGGDEFVLLWNDIGSEADCIRALERVLAEVSEPMMLEDQPVSVSASIGVTLYPDDDVDADSLLRHADHAMYTAKQLGKNRYQIFDASLERQISAQGELLSLIERGLDRGQFELYYQPKLDYVAGKVIGVEALLRWNDPVLGLVSPNEFLLLIENDSLAFRMGRWVMEEAVRQAKRWHEQGITLPISINIFPRHLKYRTFIDDLRSVIASNWPQMPEHRLLMEIIETTDLEELEPIEQVIKACVEMGIGFSLDDFGTGYSSLVYLRRLSIEEIKIDQSFVRDMLEDPDDEAIVVGVISLGRAFGLRVVAEGVETAQQAQYLVDLGCNVVQGYGLGRPMPPWVLEKWYANFNANELRI